MKNIYSKEVILLSAGLVFAGVFTACGDDSSSGPDNPVVGPDGEVVPDSILASDSLYTWYMENRSSSSSGPGNENKSSCSSSDVAASSSSVVKSSSSTAKISSSEANGKAHLLPPAGFYNELTIPVPAPLYGGTIRCTFNGSAPTSDTPEFTEPYTVTQNTPVRCAEFVGDSIARKSSHTFFINDVTSMPVVAISVDPSFFQTNYIYEAFCEGDNPKYCSPGLMEEAEHPVHVEFFEKGSASDGKAWQIDAGISLMGGWSRTYEKKSVAIKMKSIYEDGRLNYSLFDVRPEANKFKAFNLRNGGNRFVGDFVGDASLTSLAEGTAVDYQRSRQVVVFYNGMYYGVHDLRERLNEHFVETNYGIDSKQVNLVKHIGHSVTATGGTVDSYIAMLDLIHASDFSGENNAAYSQVTTMLDVGSFAEYLALEFYIHNGDWPDNNVRAWQAPGQPYKYMIYDVDHGFGWEWGVTGFMTSTHNMFKWMKQGGQKNCNDEHCLSEMYIKLIENPDFRRLFINRGAVLLSSYLTRERVEAAVNRIVAQIPADELERDLSWFPRPSCPYPSFDKTGYYTISYAATRTQTVRDEYRAEFSLGEDISVSIAANGNGKVLLEGQKLPSSDYTGTFFEGNDMLLQAVPVGGGVFDSWEDGSKENPRLVTPKNGDRFVAKFK